MQIRSMRWIKNWFQRGLQGIKEFNGCNNSTTTFVSLLYSHCQPQNLGLHMKMCINEGLVKIFGQFIDQLYDYPIKLILNLI